MDEAAEMREYPDINLSVVKGEFPLIVVHGRQGLADKHARFSNNKK